MWPGRGVPNLSHACPAGKGSLETRQKEKRDPNDADDGGQGGQHHQHHWGSVSPFLASHAPNDPSLVKIVSHPKLPLGLGASFQNGARAHDAHLGGSWGPQKCLKNPSVPWGFAVGARVNFGAVSGWGPGGARGETEVR